MTQEPKIFPYIARLLQGTEVVWKPLGEVAEVSAGNSAPQDNDLFTNGVYPFCRTSDVGKVHHSINFHQIQDKLNEEGIKGLRLYKKETILLPKSGASTLLNHRVMLTIDSYVSSHLATIYRKEEVVLAKFLFYFLSKFDIAELVPDKSYPSLKVSEIAKLPIPLPPLSVQQEIVRILDKFTQLEAELEAELDCRLRQYEYYRNKLLSYEGNEVEWKTLDQISENLDSKRQPITSGLRTSGKIPYYGASGIVDYVEDYIFDGDFLLISEDGANLLARNTPIAFSVSGKIWVNNHAHILKFRTYEERRFIEFYLNKTDLTPYISGAAQPKLNKKNLNSIKIPIPPLEEQQRIVTILDKFDTLVNSISEGLPKEIALRRKQYEYYREKLLSFPKK
ncbi:restriction endonuclease subunit S [Capnocytophaga bilenii]